MDARLKKVIDYTAYLADDFLQRQHVVACGAGYRTVKNLRTDEPCVVVSVNRKVHPNSLASEDMIPAKIDDVRTDVIQTGFIRPHGTARTSLMRPVRPGVSVGHKLCTAGTFGCVLLRGGRKYLLSANHVFAHLNEGLIGDVIIQPGTVDGGIDENAIAVLSSFVPLRFTDGMSSPDAGEKSGCLSYFTRSKTNAALLSNDGTVENFMDAAIALPFDENAISAEIIDLGGPPTGQIEGALGMKVVKSGRTTGLTQGMIIQTHVSIEIDFGGKKARFKDQLMLSGMSQPGDSGALVVDQQRRAVAMLFAGSDQVSVATPIKTILNTFDAKLVTEK